MLGGFPNRRRAKRSSPMKPEFDKPLYEGRSPRDHPGVEEKQLQFTLAFFLRCRIGNDGL
jgi:hypothetical protein